ncbi:uncharacterized protein LOC116846847 isoform X2 [Odontomachus brunneus]|uniref:uncharacterized protein LOC116846847 isoform X2 n=1 Tax=Odontomachus brunneus TaxID=486640 RepID=UPI0013F1FBD6|nr:uncharacterized protein LOC116846847 isoform X2 [Odontomachus brunneus]
MDNIELRKRLMSLLAIIISDQFLKSIENITDNSDTEDEKSTIWLGKHRHRLHGACKKPLRIKGYVERTIQGLSEKQFHPLFQFASSYYPHYGFLLLLILIDL